MGWGDNVAVGALFSIFLGRGEERSGTVSEVIQAHGWRWLHNANMQGAAFREGVGNHANDGG